MKSYLYILIGLLLLLLSACGAGTRSVATTSTANTCTTNADCASGYVCTSNVCTAVSPPSGCSADSDCGAGYMCQNNACVQRPTVLNPAMFTSCEYYGYSSTLDSSVCNNGSTTVSFTAIKNDTDINNTNTDWKTGLAYLRVSEAQSLMANQQATNIYGNDVKISIIGGGVNNIISTDNDKKEMNINKKLSVDYGYAYNNTDSGGIFNEVTREYEGYKRSEWQLYNSAGDTVISYDDYGKVTKGKVCNSNDSSNSECSHTIYVNQDYYIKDANGELTFRDRDWFTYGVGDVTNTTQLASIIAKDDSENMVGVAKESEIVSVKTNFLYQKSNYMKGTYANTTYNMDNEFSFVMQDNTGILLNNALDYAKKNSEVILFDNHLRYTNNNHNHYYFRKYGNNTKISCDYNLNDVECGSENDYRSFVEIINKNANPYFASFKDKLNTNDDIYVTPIANSLVASLISNSNSNDNRLYKTLLGVADTNVSSISYCVNNTDSGCDQVINNIKVLDVNGKDKYGVSEVKNITLDSTSVFKGNFDCSSIVSTNCVIAPAGRYTISKTGEYKQIDSQEYGGSAYVAGIITAIRGAYSTSELSNEDIIAKLVATATDPSKISGCDTVAKNCGAGMVNFYDFVKVMVNNSIKISSVNGNFDLDNTNMILSSAFGDGISTNSMSLVSKAMFFDDFNFAYNAGLQNRISSVPVNHILVKNLLEDNVTLNTNHYNIGGTASFNLNTVEDKGLLSNRFVTEYEDDEVKASITNIEFTESVGDIDVKVAFNSNYSNTIYRNSAISSSNNYFNLNTGHHNNSIGIAKQLNKELTLSSNWLHYGDNNFYITKLDYNPNKKTIASLSLGLLHENNKILGTQTSGGFGQINASNTQYLNLQFLHNIKSYQFFGNMATGVTKVDMTNNGLITDISDFTTQELQFGINKNFKDKSTIGFSYTEPLRITSGDMEFTVPTHRNITEGIMFDTSRISIKPYGKERNYEIYFNKSLNKNTSLSVNLLRITEAGNIANNQNSDALIIKFKKQF